MVLSMRGCLGFSRFKRDALDMTFSRRVRCARHDVFRCAQNDDQRVRHFDPPRRRKSPDFRKISLDGAIDEGVSRLRYAALDMTGFLGICMGWCYR